ncbi:MAG: peptidase domain-containing ABC transporter [Sphingomonas sp.]
MPITWFEKRHVGDILSRFQSIRPIQDLLINGAVATLIDGAMALLLLIVMFFYNVTMALVAVGAFALYLIVRLLTFPVERRAQEDVIIAGGFEQTTLIESVRGMVALRLANRETMRQIVWQNRLTDKINADLNLRQIAIWQETANLLIFGLEFIGSLYIGILAVLGGGLTIGMLFAFVAYKTQFITKGTALADKYVLFRMIGLHLERLSDIALAEDDISFKTASRARTVMAGKIELRDIRFRYARGEPEVLSGVNLTVEAGEHVAITGVSGGGKSTLVKILLGLIEPDEGTVLIDDRPLGLFGHKCAHDQMAGVLQDDILFSGTLLDNITMFDPEPDLAAVYEAARQASMHKAILELPMQYNTFTGEMGSSLSGGQKQRVILARALYRKPRLLVMDEGTAQLDVQHESEINAAIRTLKITRIIVAHRSETIASADRVFEMANGRLKERS